jgi:hypothetical protein
LKPTKHFILPYFFTDRSPFYLASVVSLPCTTPILLSKASNPFLVGGRYIVRSQALLPLRRSGAKWELPLRLRASVATFFKFLEEKSKLFNV